MTKKILSVITTAAVLGTMACAGAVSSSAYSGEITFEVPETWANANKFFYAHIWNGLPGGAGLYAWQTADEKMTWTKGDATATYQVPDGDWNLIIVSGNTGIQTYDTVMNANCIGDTCYVMSEQFENPVDSKKVAYGLGWRNNTDCGPHKVVSSLGNIIGNAFLPGEDNQTLYDNFVKKYDENNTPDPDNDIFNWNDDGKVETGKDWTTIKKEVADKLGVSSEVPTEAATAETATDAATTTSSQGGGSSSSSKSTPSSTVTGSDKTTTTGDSTPVVPLFAVLGASLAGALGIAFLARKESEE